MAVQQNKKSASKRGMHRAHDFLTPPALATEPVSGETHRRHHISPSARKNSGSAIAAPESKPTSSVIPNRSMSGWSAFAKNVRATATTATAR